MLVFLIDFSYTELLSRELYIWLPVVDVTGDVNQFYRKLARQRRESRVEDLPFKISSAVSGDKHLVFFFLGFKCVVHLELSESLCVQQGLYDNV